MAPGGQSPRGRAAPGMTGTNEAALPPVCKQMLLRVSVNFGKVDVKLVCLNFD